MSYWDAYLLPVAIRKYLVKLAQGMTPKQQPQGQVVNIPKGPGHQKIPNPSSILKSR